MSSNNLDIVYKITKRLVWSLNTSFYEYETIKMNNSTLNICFYHFQMKYSITSNLLDINLVKKYIFFINILQVRWNLKLDFNSKNK